MYANKIYELASSGEIKLINRTSGKYYNKCIHCNKIYESDNTYDWFCSEECYNNNSLEYGITKELVKYDERRVGTCVLCGRKYFTDINIRSINFKKDHSEYDCLRNHICHDCRKIKNIRNNTIYLKTCKTCGRTFSHYSEKHDYCSRQCSMNRKEISYIKSCQSCGKKFRTRNLNIFCCSKECLEKYHNSDGVVQKYSDIMSKRDY